MLFPEAASVGLCISSNCNYNQKDTGLDQSDVDMTGSQYSNKSLCTRMDVYIHVSNFRFLDLDHTSESNIAGRAASFHGASIIYT